MVRLAPQFLYPLTTLEIRTQARRTKGPLSLPSREASSAGSFYSGRLVFSFFDSGVGGDRRCPIDHRWTTYYVRPSRKTGRIRWENCRRRSSASCPLRMARGKEVPPWKTFVHCIKSWRAFRRSIGIITRHLLGALLWMFEHDSTTAHGTTGAERTYVGVSATPRVPSP